MFKRTFALVIAVALIITGVALAGYPLYLTVQSRLEQRRLEKEFQAYVPYFEPDLDIPGHDQPIWPDFGKVKLPQWEEHPPTKVEIPAIDMEVNLVNILDMGIFARKLNQPPSYYPHSAFPGEIGNVSIAGHRNGPAGYFKNLDKLDPGDLIILHAPGVKYYYEVERVFIVEPTEVHVVAPTDYAALTLTTCQKVGNNTSAKRLIVRAKFRDASITD